jgi:uncharacterized protein (TIGR01777 family)
MRVAVTGATGTIGGALVRALVARGDQATALSRDAGRAAAQLGVEAATWADPPHEAPPRGALRGHDAVVNLVGERLDQRWTDATKQVIRDSRVLSTRNLVSALGELPEAERPGVLLSQSGVDFYGARGDEEVTEGSAPGDDFLARVVRDWEAEAQHAEDLGMRVVVTRTAAVLTREGGALARMLPFFKLGVGGPVAGGRQRLAWVHLDDVVAAMLFLLDTNAARGAFNLTAPEAPTNKEFSRALGRALGRPAIAPVPGFVVRALYGEMASTVTAGRRTLPARLLELGYRFRHPELDEALRDALGR